MTITEEERKYIETIIFRTRIEVIKEMKKHPRDILFGWKEEKEKDEQSTK
jgi:hypothetical protein